MELRKEYMNVADNRMTVNIERMAFQKISIIINNGNDGSDEV